LNPAGGSYLAVIATSVTLVMWAFVGLESGTVPAADMKDPERLIPKILITGTVNRSHGLSNCLFGRCLTLTSGHTRDF
jgi:amino acid transporter